MPTVAITFQSTLASVPPSQLQFEWLQSEITATELIARTVTEQCRQLVERQALQQREAVERITRQYLSDADIQKMAETGRIALHDSVETSSPDASVEVAVALEAFRRRRFLILAGEQQIHYEDEVVPLNPFTLIRFVRLIALRGG